MWHISDQVTRVSGLPSSRKNRLELGNIYGVFWSQGVSEVLCTAIVWLGRATVFPDLRLSVSRYMALFTALFIRGYPLQVILLKR